MEKIIFNFWSSEQGDDQKKIKSFDLLQNIVSIFCKTFKNLDSVSQSIKSHDSDIMLIIYKVHFTHQQCHLNDSVN